MMNNKEDNQDIRKYLSVDELIRLSDLELMLLMTKSKETFGQLEVLIDKYYEIASMRKQISELTEDLESKKEDNNDS